jgi:hypothetical protein
MESRDQKSNLDAANEGAGAMNEDTGILELHKMVVERNAFYGRPPPSSDTRQGHLSLSG